MQLPLLVIDTNMVYTDRGLRSSYWEALAVAVAAGEVEVAFPEVVVRETARHLENDSKAARKELVDAVKQIGEVLESSALADQWPALRGLPSVRELRASEGLSEEKTRQRFRDRLSEMGFGIAPLPSPTHDVLVDWSLRAHPPFDATDKGYRDALIWWTFVELARADPQRCVVYVTNDNDCLEKGETTPKPELAARLTEHGLTAVRFARRIDDALKVAQQARDEAAASTLAAAEVRALLYQPLMDKLLNLTGVDLLNETHNAGWESLVEDLVLPSDIESPRVSEISIPEPLFQNIRDDYSGSVLIGTGQTRVLELGWEGFLYKSDFYALNDDETEQIHVLDADWNDHMMEVGGYLSVVAEFEFSIDPKTEKVLAAEITQLQSITDLDEV